jgi:hypothetical protein
MIFKEAPKIDEPTQCAISMEDFVHNQSIINKLPCGHWFMAE